MVRGHDVENKSPVAQIRRSTDETIQNTFVLIDFVFAISCLTFLKGPLRVCGMLEASNIAYGLVPTDFVSISPTRYETDYVLFINRLTLMAIQLIMGLSIQVNLRNAFGTLVIRLQ